MSGALMQNKISKPFLSSSIELKILRVATLNATAEISVNRSF